MSRNLRLKPVNTFTLEIYEAKKYLTLPLKGAIENISFWQHEQDLSFYLMFDCLRVRLLNTRHAKIS